MIELLINDQLGIVEVILKSWKAHKKYKFWAYHTVL